MLKMRIYQIVSYFFCVLLIGRKSEYTLFFLFQDFNACIYSAILLISNVVGKKKKNKKKKELWDGIGLNFQSGSTVRTIFGQQKRHRKRGGLRERDKND